MIFFSLKNLVTRGYPATDNLDTYPFPVKLRKAHKSFPLAFQKKSKYPNLPVTGVLRTTRVLKRHAGILIPFRGLR